MSFAAALSTSEQNPDIVVAGMLSVLRALAAAFVAAFGDPSPEKSPEVHRREAGNLRGIKDAT